MLSRLQTDPEELRATVARLLRTTMLAAVPVLMVIFACSDELLAVLGSPWAPASTALQLLCLVGIGKAIAFYTGPVLFAASRPRFRAVMLWIVAIVSVASVAAVGAALAGASVRTQVTGMAGSRAILFLPILVPVNLLIVARITGMRVRALLPAVPGPLFAGAAAIVSERALHATGIVDGLAPVPALLLVGATSALSALLVLLSLEPVVRAQTRRVGGRAAARAARTPARRGRRVG